MHVRNMEEDDLGQVAKLSAAAFELEIDDAAALASWTDRMAFPLRTDPGGAFVAEEGGHVVGAAQALRRDRLWVLSLLAVEPGIQSGGAGGELLERTLAYAEGTDAGLIVSSNDPRAMRLYARVGFRLLPTLKSEGQLDRAKLPAADPRIREGGLDDLKALEDVSRAIRGAPHTTELSYALSIGGRLFMLGDRGFVVAHREWGVWLLVARDEECARALLWTALALRSDGPRGDLRWLTAEQQWAIETAVGAGFRLSAYGALCVRGDPGPLAPFIPSGPFA